MSLNARPAHRQIANCLPLLVGCLLGASVAQAQFPEAPGRPPAFAWDYPDQWVAEFSVSRFEIRIDAWPPARVGVSSRSIQPDSYVTPIPAMPTGQHLVEVRACSPATCGAWSTPLLFVFVPVYCRGAAAFRLATPRPTLTKPSRSAWPSGQDFPDIIFSRELISLITDDDDRACLKSGRQTCRMPDQSVAWLPLRVPVDFTGPARRFTQPNGMHNRSSMLERGEPEQAGGGQAETPSTQVTPKPGLSASTSTSAAAMATSG